MGNLSNKQLTALIYNISYELLRYEQSTDKHKTPLFYIETSVASQLLLPALLQLQDYRKLIGELLNKEKWGTPGGYVDHDSNNYHWNEDVNAYIYRRSCTFCLMGWWDNEEEKHEHYCPINQLKQLYNKK